MFGAVKLTKNVDFDNYKHSGYGTGFNARRRFLLSDGIGFSKKNVIIFGAEMSSSLHVDNRKQDILILGKGPAQELDKITLTAEKKIYYKFCDQQKKFKFAL